MKNFRRKLLKLPTKKKKNFPLPHLLSILIFPKSPPTGSYYLIFQYLCKFPRSFSSYLIFQSKKLKYITTLLHNLIGYETSPREYPFIILFQFQGSVSTWLLILLTKTKKIKNKKGYSYSTTVNQTSFSSAVPSQR